MSLCLCRSSLKESQGGQGYAFHPLISELSCPLHPTSGERDQQSDIQGIDFEPPVLRLWPLDDYLNDEIDDTNSVLSELPFVSEAGSSPEQSTSQSKTSTPFRPNPAEVEGPLVDVETTKERKGSLPARAPEQQIIPDQDDWERYKNVIENLYQTFVSALAAFSLNDFVLGGRLLRGAFRALDSEIDHLSAIRSVENCFSIPYLFVSYERNDLATLMLKYMAPRLQMTPKRHSLAIICGPLLSIVKDLRQPSPESLDWVLKLGTDTFAEAHSDDFRAVLYFRARFCTLNTGAVEEIFFGYQRLVAEYSARFGKMHPTTLSTEREMLDLAARYRLKPVMARDLCELAIAKIEDHYAERNIPTQRWSHSHQKLWMDLGCLLVEIVASGGDLPQAIKRSREIYGFVTNTSGCLPSNRWYAINSFQIWLETMVHSLGQVEVGDEFRTSCLSSEQYLVLDKESIDEEENFSNSHN